MMLVGKNMAAPKMSTAVENPNVRISPHAKAMLRELHEREGKPMRSVLDQVIERYRREVFFRELDAGYGKLQANSEAWKEELAERREWDTTLMDDLQGE